ncbi:MAG TPA: cytosine deaminase [Chroococcidiopsis sp.]
MHPDFAPLTADAYWLTNAHVPRSLLLGEPSATPSDLSQVNLAHADLAHVDLEITGGIITQIVAHGDRPSSELPTVDLRRGQVWCTLIDMHTHLDKGHIWQRSPNRTGTFEDALITVERDREQRWNVDDVYRRMEFGLKCSYAHGTRAIRTHIDALNGQADISLKAIQTLQAEWSDRITLQAVSLLPLDIFLTPEGDRLADQFAAVDGVLGGFPLMSPDLDLQLDRIFTLAQERQLSLDFHCDETGQDESIVLRHVAAAALRHQFSGQVVCGHCCSLSTQSPEQAQITLDLVKQANIGIVSLPMCNLYLQDRNQRTSSRWLGEWTKDWQITPDRTPATLPTQTPRWRGITLIHELHHWGIPVAIASDNCRDPFYGFGDHDGLEVFTQGVRIAHLDAPYAQWCRTVTTTPADLMGLPTAGRIGVGLPADLILFKARYFSELLSRPQSDRIVLRHGKPIDTTLPDYTELDDLLLP